MAAPATIQVSIPMQTDTLIPKALTNERLNRTLLDNVHPSAWEKPQPADKYNLVILGAGPAGILTALEAAKLGAKVALIERNLLGGVCLNTGCIPSKAILRTSRLYREMRDAEQFGGRAPSG